MKSVPPEPAEILHRVRQQLILAQVRIMELEDARDGVAARLADCEALLSSAQSIADQKIDEAGHLAKVRDDLQAQFEHMRHMQHVTNEALIATRAELGSVQAGRDELMRQIGTLSAQIEELNRCTQSLRQELADSESLVSRRGQRISALNAELAALRATRSWRWTAWLRSIGGSSSGRKS